VVLNVVVFQLRPYAKFFFSSIFHLKDFTMPIEIPFLPQAQISQQILQGLAQANQEHADQLAAQARQKQLGIAQQEADVASRRLAVETPYIQAQTANLLTESQRAAQALARNQFASDYLAGNSGHGSEQHIAGVVGDNGHYGVPLEAPAPQPLSISDPTGQLLAVPPAPVATQPISAPATPVANAPIAPPSAGSSLTAPAPVAQPQGGVYADINEVSRRIGGLTQPEADQIALALKEAQLNTNPAEAIAKFQSDLAAIVARRGSPEYATQIAFMRQGYSEPAAIQAAKRNTAIDAELTKIESAPEELAGDKASVAKGSLTALAQSGGLTQENQQRAQRLAGVAAIAEKNQLAADAAKKRAEQAAKDGDPVAAARLLTSGLVAPSQLISVRNPDFATKAFTAAAKLDPTFNLQKAEADYRAASSPANLNFFGPAKSMVEKGGTLDQLEAAAKDIPGGQIPVFNKLADAEKAALGSGPVAKYAAIALGVADDYSKITGGGGSDSSREQALHLLPIDASPEARKASLSGIRGTVNSQIHSRIGNNRVLQLQYGDDTTPAGPSGLSTGASNYLNSIGVKH
jgi:hypothetical protein